jgi:lipopolysaccharide export LptBFGC system permease protein LptF
MSDSSHTPSGTVKIFGSIVGTVKEFVNGFDMGSSIPKIPLWILGITVTAIFAPYIIGGGLALAVAYLLRAAYKEYKSNQEELEKLERKGKLDRQLLLLDEELSEKLIESMKNLPHFRALLLDARLSQGSERGAQTILQLATKKTFLEKYAPLSQNITTKATNQQLLKCVLSDYFAAFGENPTEFKKENGKLPSQRKILNLIEKVTGYSSFQPNFHANMNNFLADDRELQNKFNQSFPDSDLSEDGIWSALKNKFVALKATIKNQKKLRHAGKYFLDFLNDFGTGAGITGSLLSVFGVLIVGTAVAWPLVVAVIGSGFLYGGIAFAYNLIRHDTRRRNSRVLDSEIEQQETRIELSKHLLKIQNQEKLRGFSRFGYYSNADNNNSVFDQGAELNHQVNKKTAPIKQKVNANIPTSFYLRAGLGIVCQTISTVALAVCVSLGVVWIGALLFPVVPFVMPTLILGGVLSALSLYRSLKSAAKSINKEVAKFQEVAEHKQQLLDKYPQNEQVRADLTKDNRTLLRETLSEYISFVRQLGNEKAKNAKGKYPKQEKIFSLIEAISGAKRHADGQGRIAITGDDTFYNEVAKCLKGDAKESAAANALAQDFKNLFLHSPPGLTNSRVNADDPLLKKESFLKKAGGFIEDHPFVFISVVSLSIMLPLFLAGPQLILVGVVGGLIFGGSMLIKITSTLSEKNVKSLQDKKAKFDIIDRKHKLIKHQERPHHSCGQVFPIGSRGKKKQTATEEFTDEIKPVAGQPTDDFPSSSAQAVKTTANVSSKKLAGSLIQIWDTGASNKQQVGPLSRFPSQVVVDSIKL